jgi:SAM-dependent methyltransferase
MPAVPVCARYEVDVRRPSAARIHDYYLGGVHNFAVDRAFAKQAVRIEPELPLVSRANRAFLRRAVRHCHEAGIRQFLDLGSGIPTCGAVHETAPSARVVYVDHDRPTVAFGSAILRESPLASMLQADFRCADRVFRHPEMDVDLSAPFAVLMIDVLRYVDEGTDPARLVRAYRDALPPNGFLAVSHTAPVESFVDGLAVVADGPVRLLHGGHAALARKPA